jgi:Ca-activated chloride channel family protein
LCLWLISAVCLFAGRARGEDILVELLYGSEKRVWITKVTEAYNRAGHRVGDKRVEIRPIAAGSGEAMEDLLSGRSKAQLFSPASGLFVEMGNARAQRRDGKPLVGPTHTLVLSPVVIAMWKPMAEALGWPGKRIGWSDVLSLANDPEGWATLHHPEFGSFKFGHTHPEYSNSGLISVLAEVYAGAGLPRNAVLLNEHLGDPKVGAFLRGIESSVVYYGKSTGFFADSMFDDGYSALSAAVLYESSVIESYDLRKHPKMEDFIARGFPVVAIYPSDGTFWSDHPIGIVERNASPEQRQAAQEYIRFLLHRDQQRLAMETGFRPGDDGIALAAPLDRAHGVDPDIDIPVRLVPSNDVIEFVLKLWRDNQGPWGRPGHRHPRPVGTLQRRDRIRPEALAR